MSLEARRMMKVFIFILALTMAEGHRVLSARHSNKVFRTPSLPEIAKSSTGTGKLPISPWKALAALLLSSPGADAFNAVNAVSRTNRPMNSESFVTGVSPAANVLQQRGGPRRSEVHMNFFVNFLKELDAFVDDAANRRLGQGAKFYGKRKSNFYGEQDEMRKKDPNMPDREEDYSGPAGGSYFVLSEERDEQGRPLGFLTRGQAREAKRAKKEEELQMSQSMRDEFARKAKRVQREEDSMSEATNKGND